MRTTAPPMALAGLLLTLAAAPSASHAALRVAVRDTVPLGATESPAMLITPSVEVEWIRIELTRTGPGSETERVTLRPRLVVGQENEVALPHPPGSFSWSGTLSLGLPDGSEGEMPLSFRTSRLAALDLTSDATREDVLARRVTMKADRPARRATVEVKGPGGKRLGLTELDLGEAPAGSDLVIEWEQQVEGEPLMVEVRIEDVNGTTNEIVWTPWWVSIDHETVEFDTGQARIRDGEVHKLQDVLDKLNHALRMYDGVVEASVWIAGHTDTVGSKENNRRLSEARARAIANWFRRAGVRVPIRYQGFGQDALLVKTEDEVDEPRNRRAEYVVSVEDPYAGRGVQGAWRRLP